MKYSTHLVHSCEKPILAQQRERAGGGSQPLGLLPEFCFLPFQPTKGMSAPCYPGTGGGSYAFSLPPLQWLTPCPASPSSHMERHWGTLSSAPSELLKHLLQLQSGQSSPAEPAELPGKLQLSPRLPAAWDPSLLRTALLLHEGGRQSLLCSQKRGYFAGTHLLCT